MRQSGRQGSSSITAESYFDINQLELAYVNRAIKRSRKVGTPPFVNIGRSKKILRIQKKNLERLCKRRRKERREGHLERELKLIMRGRKRLSISCFLFR